MIHVCVLILCDVSNPLNPKPNNRKYETRLYNITHMHPHTLSQGSGLVYKLYKDIIKKNERYFLKTENDFRLRLEIYFHHFLELYLYITTLI